MGVKKGRERKGKVGREERKGKEEGGEERRGVRKGKGRKMNVRSMMLWLCSTVPPPTPTRQSIQLAISPATSFVQRQERS